MLVTANKSSGMLYILATLHSCYHANTHYLGTTGYFLPTRVIILLMSLILFDFDGTLVQTQYLAREIFNECADEFGLEPISLVEMKELQKSGAKQLFSKKKISLLKIVRVVRRIQLGMRRKLLQVEPVRGINQVLQELKKQGHSLGIVTSNSQENVENYVKKQKWEMFEFIHAEKNFLGKGRVLQKIVKKYGISLNDSFYVGDEVRDIEAGKEAKMRVIAVSWGFNDREILQKKGADFIIDHPGEILEFFGKIGEEAAGEKVKKSKI